MGDIQTFLSAVAVFLIIMLVLHSIDSSEKERKEEMFMFCVVNKVPPKDCLYNGGK